MPILDVHLPAGRLGPEAKQLLAQTLTQTMLQCDLTRDNPRARAIQWVYLHEFDVSQLYIGGELEGRPHYRVDIWLMQNAMPESLRDQVVGDITREILKTEGQKPNPFNAGRVWVLFHEVADGFWGAGGRIYHWQELQQYLAEGKSSAE